MSGWSMVEKQKYLNCLKNIMYIQISVLQHGRITQLWQWLKKD